LQLRPGRSVRHPAALIPVELPLKWASGPKPQDRVHGTWCLAISGLLLNYGPTGSCYQKNHNFRLADNSELFIRADNRILAHDLDYFFSRIDGVKVTSTNNPSGAMKRLTVWPHGSFLFLISIRYPRDSRCANLLSSQAILTVSITSVWPTIRELIGSVNTTALHKNDI
jgi:hypothetical protein